MRPGDVVRSPWSLFAIAFGCLFLAVGLYAMFDSLRGIVEGCRASVWPETTATVLESRFVNTSDEDGQCGVARVCYSYQVDGRESRGSTIHPAYRGSGFLDVHRGLAQGLHPSRKVVVHYAEAHPERSTLAVGFYSSTLAGVFIGALLLLAVGGCILIGLRRKMNFSRSQRRILLGSLGALLVLWILFFFAGNDDFLAGVRFVE